MLVPVIYASVQSEAWCQCNVGRISTKFLRTDLAGHIRTQHVRTDVAGQFVSIINIRIHITGHIISLEHMTSDITARINSKSRTVDVIDHNHNLKIFNNRPP